MSTGKQFIDSFWSSDILSTAGFDALCKRAKTGGQTCKDIADFLAQRSKIEIDYSRNLERLAKSYTRADIGESHTLTQGWFQMVNQVDRISDVHQEASNLYKSQSDRLLAFIEDQKTERRRIQDTVRKSQTNKINTYNKTLTMQKTYYMKCREAKMMKHSYEQAKLTTPTQQKELDKLKQKMEKCAFAIEQSDSNYRNSVESLGIYHQQWEQDMEETCQVFQNLEESRLDTLRRKLWTASNVASRVCVSVDDCCEVVRESLALCDLEHDMDEFITRFGTGHDRPLILAYMNFYSVDSNHQARRARVSGDSGIKADLSMSPTSSDAGEYEYASIE